MLGAPTRRRSVRCSRSWDICALAPKTPYHIAIILLTETPMSRKTDWIPDTLYDYLLSVSLREHPVLLELRDATESMAEAAMQIAPEQGQFMQLLVRLIGARRALEVGVFTGYSALAVALALPEDGRLTACDVSDEWTSIGRRYWERAGMAGKIDLRLAPAAETLEELLADGMSGTFDFAFIDADKTGYELYYERSLELLRPGGLMLLDNTLWESKVADPSERDPETEAIRKINVKVHSDDRVDLSLLPIADGLTLVRKR